MCTNPLRGSDNLLVDMWLAIGYFDLRFSSSGEYLFDGLPQFALKGSTYPARGFKLLLSKCVSRVLTSRIFSGEWHAGTTEEGGLHCPEVCHVLTMYSVLPIQLALSVVLLLHRVVLHPSLYYCSANQSAPNSVLHRMSPPKGQNWGRRKKVDNGLKVHVFFNKISVIILCFILILAFYI
jgi:hypothetical protein